MAIVRWFGGRISSDSQEHSREHEVVPHSCHLVRTGRGPIWTVGEWTRTEIRTVGVGDRQVTVFGECAATDPELHQLAACGVTDGVLTAFAGSYTVVESTAHRTTVFTDSGHARAIYLSDTAGGIVWGSSALALAALTNAQPDIGWLGAALLVPQRPDLLASRSAFVGITSVPPGSRLVLANDAPPQVRAAWNPAPPRASLAEGAALLRTALSDAVAVRIDSSRHPSADCSGGMDSTSLALLAAGRLDNQRCLHAVTIHPAGTTHGGDLDYARMATEGRPAIRHLLCPLDSRHLPYSRMAGLMPPTDELPPPIAVRHTKGDFTPDHYLGLRANATVLRELADGWLAERGLVDPDRLRGCSGRPPPACPSPSATSNPWSPPKSGCTRSTPHQSPRDGSREHPQWKRQHRDQLRVLPAPRPVGQPRHAHRTRRLAHWPGRHTPGLGTPRVVGASPDR
jgi:Asparagine synthase